jgi:hypothetical protein
LISLEEKRNNNSEMTHSIQKRVTQITWEALRVNQKVAGIVKKITR